jgi:hypothetical protein
LIARHQWLTPVILAIQEAEIRKITVRSQPWQIVQETLSQKKKKKKNLHKTRAGGSRVVAQGEGPEFKPQYHQKRKRKGKLSQSLKIGLEQVTPSRLSHVIYNCLSLHFLLAQGLKVSQR